MPTSSHNRLVEEIACGNPAAMKMGFMLNQRAGEFGLADEERDLVRCYQVVREPLYESGQMTDREYSISVKLDDLLWTLADREAFITLLLKDPEIDYDRAPAER